jgi:hypothetical protein
MVAMKKKFIFCVTQKSKKQMKQNNGKNDELKGLVSRDGFGF